MMVRRAIATAAAHALAFFWGLIGSPGIMGRTTVHRTHAAVLDWRMTMGFSTETIAKVTAEHERQARRDKWICTPGLHVVRIVRWSYAGAHVGRDVVFELHDDAGRQQFVRFNLTIRSLRDGELLRFVVAAMNWRPELHEGDMFSIAHRRYYEQLIGRRIAVVVFRDKRGLHSVVDWRAVAQ